MSKDEKEGRSKMLLIRLTSSLAEIRSRFSLQRSIDSVEHDVASVIDKIQKVRKHGSLLESKISSLERRQTAFEKRILEAVI